MTSLATIARVEREYEALARADARDPMERPAVTPLPASGPAIDTGALRVLPSAVLCWCRRGMRVPGVSGDCSSKCGRAA